MLCLWGLIVAFDLCQLLIDGSLGTQRIVLLVVGIAAQQEVNDVAFLVLYDIRDQNDMSHVSIIIRIGVNVNEVSFFSQIEVQVLVYHHTVGNSIQVVLEIVDVDEGVGESSFRIGIIIITVIVLPLGTACIIVWNAAGMHALGNEIHAVGTVIWIGQISDSGILLSVSYSPFSVIAVGSFSDAAGVSGTAVDGDPVLIVSLMSFSILFQILFAYVIEFLLII